MLYDEEVKRVLADAASRGYRGDALTLEVAKAFEVDAMSVAQANLLAESFKRIVWPAAKKSVKPQGQPKLFA